MQLQSSLQMNPVEVVVVTINTTPAAVLVPESAAMVQCTVLWCRISVKRAERLALVVAECITGVTWVPPHVQHVVVRLWLDYERTVLGVVPVAGVDTWLQVNPQLIAAGQCQLTEQVVAKPVVASRVVETGFVLLPWTVEIQDVKQVNVLLDQQVSAVVYRSFTPTNHNCMKLCQWALFCRYTFS